MPPVLVERATDEFPLDENGFHHVERTAQHQIMVSWFGPQMERLIFISILGSPHCHDRGHFVLLSLFRTSVISSVASPSSHSSDD